MTGAPNSCFVNYLMPEQIIIIEDDSEIAESLRYNFSRAGYGVRVAASGEEGLRLALDGNTLVSLVILDLILPGISGLEVCRRLRREPRTDRTPIIILTAKSDHADKIAGLEAGADDYVTKPFSVREVIARARAILRRLNEDITAPPPYKDEKLSIDFESLRVYCRGDEVKLTRKEFALLKKLVTNHGRVMTRQNLMDGVWGYNYDGDARTLDVHIRRLRQKLGDCGNSVETVVGTGYRFSGTKQDVC